MFGFFEKKEKTSLVIDVGNGSLACAILSVNSSKIIFSERISFLIPDDVNMLRIESEVSVSIEKCLNKIKNNKLFKKIIIEDVLVSVSSPWFVTNTKKINISENRAFVITERFIEDLLQKESEKFRLEEEKKNIEDQKISVIDKEIMFFKLNGYNIKNIIGKKIKSLESQIYFSGIREKLEKSIFKVLNKNIFVNNNKIVIKSFPFIMFSVLKNITLPGDNFIIMDITGETTDISLVYGGVIIKNVNFSSGRNFILRQISKKMDVSLEIAESMLHMYTDKKSDEKSYQNISDILSSVREEWFIYFNEAISEISKGFMLPSKIFVTSDDDVYPFYEDCIKIFSDNPYLSKKDLVLVHINKDILKKIYIDKSVKKTDEFIMVICIFKTLFSI